MSTVLDDDTEDVPDGYSSRYYQEPPIDYTDDEDEMDCESNFENKIEHPTPTHDAMPMIEFDQLTFEKLISHGGFGKVYRGRLDDSFTVAIKEPIYFHHQSISTINRSIIDEARIHFSLEHPNIIKMFGISMHHRKVFLVMEYAHGRSLRELLDKRTLSPNIIIKFAIQISSAMEYLHSLKPRPIIHRDLKSLNILLNEPIHDGKWSTKQLKLTDLGLAREFSNSASMMTQCGTYAWMAPESITDSKFSRASDVWSFGVVLWELLTGQIPYKNVSGAAVAFGIGNRKLTLPIPKTCPKELKRIMQECWFQNPKFRPSFKKIRGDLEQSSFNVINMEKFQKMKQNWFDEIEAIWSSLKEKEKELEFREEKAKLKEEEAHRKEMEIEQMKRFLLQQSKELKRREIEVVGRELNVLLQTQTKRNVSSSSKKMLFASGHPCIGSPQNFCHNLTVTNTSHDQLPSLQAKALNQTWGPGTKVRPELHPSLFQSTISRSNSSTASTQEFQETEHGQIPPKPVHRKKRLAQFLKKIFRSSSKSNIPREESSQCILEEPLEVEAPETHIYYPSYMQDHHYLNRTYHGQTKHSERQRIHLLEHFRQVDQEDESSDQDDHSYSLIDDQQSYQQDQEELDYQTENSNEYSSIDLNNNDQHGQYYPMPEALDDDLLKEIDRFEREFQSMHCNDRNFFSPLIMK